MSRSDEKPKEGIPSVILVPDGGTIVKSRGRVKRRVINPTRGSGVSVVRCRRRTTPTTTGEKVEEKISAVARRKLEGKPDVLCRFVVRSLLNSLR